jgi:acetyl esterase/lipase
MTIRVQEDIVYATHDGVQLMGDLFLPEESAVPTGVLLLLHGGAMQQGTRKSWTQWGRFLATHGYGGFAVDYRLNSDSGQAFPDNIFDVQSAVKWLRGHAADLSLNSEAIGAMGGSAGGYLAAMLILTRNSVDFANPYVDDEFHELSSSIRVGLPMAGVFDMISQWEHDQLHRPLDHAFQNYMRGTPMSQRERYYQASPIYHCSESNARGTSWLVSWSSDDDVVDSGRQSKPFVEHVKRAGALVRTCPIPGASHFWYDGDAPVTAPGSHTALLATQLLSFLERRARWLPGTRT